MGKLKVVFWSGSGNTKAMADAVAKGANSKGVEAETIEVSDISADDLAKEKTFALGCPSMGCEQLEESEMEPFMADLDSKISGKNVGLFGSYGWGDGEWMNDWEERIVEDGAVLVEKGVICMAEPSKETIAECEQLGEKLAGLV